MQGREDGVQEEVLKKKIILITLFQQLTNDIDKDTEKNNAFHILHSQ